MSEFFIGPDGREYEPDPPEFDRSKVPDNMYAEYYFDMRTGRGLTNEEWDTTMHRLERSGPEGVEFANLIRGREG